MKYNQFAYQATSNKQQIAEMLSINFLPQNYQTFTASDLLCLLVKKIIVEARSPEAKNAKLQEIAVKQQQNLKQFASSQPTAISKVAWENIALQLLDYHVGYDYQLDDPAECFKQHAFPEINKDVLDKNDLPFAFYRLLNTRSKNGQTLIDVMAGKGYFRQFYGTGKHLIFNGKSMPVFDMNKVIREVAYVESDLDTDQDGKSDLLQVTIFRPSESAQEKIPVLYTADPYFGGIIDNEKRNHNVDTDLADATTWTNPQYQKMPRVAANKAGSKEEAQPTEAAVHHAPYTLNEYMLARGFANVYAGAIGTRGSDGVRITGAPEETIAAKEIIEWLTGDRIAYTDRNRDKEVKANWCNGLIGMTGRSYLGTLQIAVATTGVKGLKTVVSEAAISSWYDYYREHGLVVAPEACQGEDLDMLAETCQSNLWDSGSYLKIKPKFDQMNKRLIQKEDRETGQYSDFWDVRNYRKNASKIKCSWISVHGLNDWNVKPKNVYKIWQKIKHLPIPKHLFLHQGPHYNMNNLLSIDFTDLMNLWFVHELLGIPNNAEKQWATVLIQDNLQADNWHEEKDWTTDQSHLTSYYPQSEDHLSKAGDYHAKVSFIDEGGISFRKSKISESKWQYDFICGREPWAKASIRLTTDHFVHPVTIYGRPEIKLRVKTDKNVGQISVALVELASRKRLTPTPVAISGQIQELGYRFGTETLKEFKPDSVTQAKLITKAHMNLQNYQDMKKPAKILPDKYYDLCFKLQPTYYRVPAGSQLAVIIYSTDQAMTKRPLSKQKFTIDLAHTEISWAQK